MASKRALWHAQRAAFKDSVLIEPYEVLEWCNSAKTEHGKTMRYRQIAGAIQFSTVIFYYIAGTDYRGYRFGTQPEDYASLYIGE